MLSLGIDSCASRAKRVLFAFGLLAVFVSVAFAQSDTGRLQGTVTDSSGAVVSGATITVTSLGTDRVVTVQSGAAGEFSVPSLNPGQYRIDVKAANFKSETQDITLEVAQVLPLTFKLTPGAVSENVEVSSEAPMVATASSDLGDTIVGRQVTELPLNGRNFTQLATLAPGVTRGPNINGNANGTQGNAETYRYNTSGGAVLSVNGLRAQANNFLLDGFDNNESLVNTIVFYSSPDAIQEFHIATNVAPAEFGRAGGAIVNTAMKSGTNQIHGTVYEFIRNSALDAIPWTTADKRQEVSLQAKSVWCRRRRPHHQEQTVYLWRLPGTAQLSARQHRLRHCTHGLDAQQRLHQLFRIASQHSHLRPADSHAISRQHHHHDFESGGGELSERLSCSELQRRQINSNCHFLTQNYTVTRQRIETINDYDIRADWNISSKDSAFLRYSSGSDNLTTTSRLPDLPAGFGSGTNPTKPWSAVMEETHVLSPNLINEFRFGFIHTFFAYAPPFNNVPLSANLGIVNANVNAQGQPDPELGGGALIGGYNNQLEYTGDYGPYNVPQSTWQTSDNLSWVKGKHTLKFGADILRRQVNFFRPLAGKGYFDLYGNGTTDGNPQKRGRIECSHYGL